MLLLVPVGRLLIEHDGGCNIRGVQGTLFAVTEGLLSLFPWSAIGVTRRRETSSRPAGRMSDPLFRAPLLRSLASTVLGSGVGYDTVVSDQL